MITVIKPAETLTKEIECKNCKALLGYTPSDVAVLRTHTGMHDMQLTEEGFKCPTPGCGANVVTKPF